MPKEEWGTKRVCPTTGKRFYDLNRNPAISPYTGEVVQLDTSKSARTMLADKADKQSKKEEEAADEDEVVLDDDDTDVEIDDDLLEDDEDDDNVSLDEIADVSSDDDS